MKSPKLKIFSNNLFKYTPLILIILFALFLRFYNLDRRTIFEADQEEIAGKAQELLSGDPVLLGPKTSIGGFSIGPGFTYLWGFVSVFTNGNPISGAYTSVILGTAFILFIYFFTRNVYSEKTALILSLIVAFSTTLIFWDQIPWAPSLFYISEILVIYGVYISDKKPVGVVISMLGFVIGFQSHFAIFLLPPAALIYWLIYKPKITKKGILFSLLIITAGIFPGILYDLTHNLVNIERLFFIYKLATTGIIPPISKIILALITNSVSFYYMFFPEILRIVIFTVTILVCIFGAVKEIRYRKVLTLSLLFLFVPFIFFLFYRSNFSEYYLMSALPAFIILSGYAIEKVNKYSVIILPLLIILLIINLNSWERHYKPLNLWAKEQAVKTIIEMGGKSDYGISLSVDMGYGFGYPFLFKYYGAEPDIPPVINQKKIFTIVVPPGFRGIQAFKDFNGVGLRWEGL